LPNAALGVKYMYNHINIMSEATEKYHTQFHNKRNGFSSK